MGMEGSKRETRNRPVKNWKEINPLFHNPVSHGQLLTKGNPTANFFLYVIRIILVVKY
jgi:hypothetical protein